jgi:hypothetical protein
VPPSQELLMLHPPGRVLRGCAALKAWEGVRGGMGVGAWQELASRLGRAQPTGDGIAADKTREIKRGHRC